MANDLLPLGNPGHSHWLGDDDLLKRDAWLHAMWVAVPHPALTEIRRKPPERRLGSLGGWPSPPFSSPATAAAARQTGISKLKESPWTSAGIPVACSSNPARRNHAREFGHLCFQIQILRWAP
ncbi:predicted protein [Uncinocarpus reesii 1704]|uniref:Uncharacterized protein n=1 Tax=Uncinocarpus reesii (strain UAMH 1704) TaxID=336963 RepID=C4JFC8_UNCRE|nr:uncharacterized protein UREG_02350 [Uncinocarpus reesii 1704]EEP77501.1 predicted protein [Uncinocarpus reesii 1704]